MKVVCNLLSGLRVRGFITPWQARRVRGIFFAHAMVAKDAKVDTKVGIRGGLSGLSVRGFNTPRSLRTPRLIQKLGYVAVLADPVFAG